MFILLGLYCSGHSEIQFPKASVCNRFCKRLIEKLSGLFGYYLQLAKNISAIRKSIIFENVQKLNFRMARIVDTFTKKALLGQYPNTYP